MGESQTWSSTRFSSWSFIFYVNNLPKITTKNAKLILHAVDTGIIVTNPISKDLKLTQIKIC
jgi:hypothetical protein